jgi:hypothetical protein
MRTCESEKFDSVGELVGRRRGGWLTVVPYSRPPRALGNEQCLHRRTTAICALSPRLHALSRISQWFGAVVVWSKPLVRLSTGRAEYETM